MEIQELQERVDSWIKEYGVRYFNELTNMAILTEEVGELARIIARKYGEQSFKEGEKENLADEMADVLWVLTCLANQTGVDLTKAIEDNFAKKTARDVKDTKTTLKYNSFDIFLLNLSVYLIKYHAEIFLKAIHFQLFQHRTFDLYYYVDQDSRDYIAQSDRFHYRGITRYYFHGISGQKHSDVLRKCRSIAQN